MSVKISPSKSGQYGHDQITDDPQGNPLTHLALALTRTRRTVPKLSLTKDQGRASSADSRALRTTSTAMVSGLGRTHPSKPLTPRGTGDGVMKGAIRKSTTSRRVPKANITLMDESPATATPTQKHARTPTRSPPPCRIAHVVFLFPKRRIFVQGDHIF